MTVEKVIALLLKALDTSLILTPANVTTKILARLALDFARYFGLL